MKRKKFALIFLTVVLCLAFIGCLKDTKKIEAEVLTINENIFSGELIGQFLGSASGHLTNDVIKVGVKIEYGGETFLEDLSLKHAELAYFKDKKTLPITIEFFGYDDYFEIYLMTRRVAYVKLNTKITQKIINNLKKQ